MKLDDNFYLEADTNQWILHYEKEGDINPKTNKPIKHIDKWYCGSLKSALNRYLNESVKSATTVQELSALVNISMERIIELTNKI